MASVVSADVAVGGFVRLGSGLFITPPIEWRPDCPGPMGAIIWRKF